MKLAELQEKGAFINSELVPKELLWTRVVDGEEVTDAFTVHVARLSYGVFERAIGMAPQEGDRSLAAALIAAAVRLGDDGSERLTYDQAYSLEVGLATLLSNAVSEVNGLNQSKD
jgi:hypothetical protein